MSSKITRYNPKKRGSFQIELKFYDWELSILIGTIRKEKERIKGNSQIKGYITYLDKLDKKLSEALGQVLKIEFRDLKNIHKDIDEFTEKEG